MVKLPPISLQVRHAAARRDAERLLRRLDNAALRTRRIKQQAARALSAVLEMHAIAAAQVRAMSPMDERRWDQDKQTIEQILRRIIERGV